MKSEHQRLLEKAMLKEEDIRTLELLHDEDPDNDYDPYAFDMDEE